MPSLAPHTAAVPASGIRRIYEIAAQLPDVISLGVGEPDVPVAGHIIEAAIEAWNADITNYTGNGGIVELRQAIVDKLARENEVYVDIEQVWVTVGATQALHQAMQLVLSCGDEVLVPDPGYTTFTMNARMLDAVPVSYSLRPERDFLPSIAELDRLVTSRTRLLIVNSPSNPLGTVFPEPVLRALLDFARRHALGTVFPEPVLRALLDFARRHDLWVISDEVYEYFSYGTDHVSLASLDGDDRVFSVFSLSKTYAMTGVRVGYLVTPPGMSATLRSAQEATISCVNTPAQFAAIAAITGDHQHVADAKEHYRANLIEAMRVLDERRINYLSPDGAFYLWVDVSHASGGDVAAWAEHFLLEQHVAIAPGSAFGRSGEGWIRVCLAAQRDDLVEGLRRLPAP